MYRAFLYFIFVLLVQLVCGLVVGKGYSLFGFDETTKTVNVQLYTSMLSSIIIIGVALYFRWYEAGRNYLRSHPWGTLFWVSLLGASIVIPLAWMEEFIPKAWRVDISGDIVVELLQSTMGYFTICMLAPLCEEVIFRGAILRALRRWGMEKKRKAEDELGAPSGLTVGRVEWMAIIISALLFAIIHLNPAQMPHAFLLGVLMSWLTLRSNSIVPSFFIHWINNSFAYVAVNLFPNIPMDANLVAYFNGSRTAMYQAIISCLLIALPSMYQVWRRLGK